MNKRSAIAVALGLVAALAAGGFALSMGLATTGTAAKAASSLSQQKPKVHTIKRTITVHKKAKNGTRGGAIVLSDAQGGSSVGSGSDSSSVSDDDATEDTTESEDASSETEDATDDAADDATDDSTGGGDD